MQFGEIPQPIPAGRGFELSSIPSDSLKYFQPRRPMESGQFEAFQGLQFQQRSQVEVFIASSEGYTTQSVDYG